ncbi:hypothetical protein LTR74_014754 [Friedmanniomyces endolithicus]|nr:hypothetical protein LTR74_014754 [Friedmanniomyces endolithicus]
MAWRCSGPTNEALIENLTRNNLITQPRVQRAMLLVDRAHYSPSAPYEDSPQPLGHRATISAPHMHAAACESLLPFLHPGARVLDIGSGSGYLTHVLAELVRPGGRVVGVEHIEALVEMGVRNSGKSAEGRGLLEGGGIRFVRGDGRLGWEGEGPYDAIHVGAAAKGFHQALIDQLRAPGRLFMPVEEGHMQHIYVIDKKEDGTVTRTKEMGVRYVPLTDAPTE